MHISYTCHNSDLSALIQFRRVYSFLYTVYTYVAIYRNIYQTHDIIFTRTNTLCMYYYTLHLLCNICICIYIYIYIAGYELKYISN